VVEESTVVRVPVVDEAMLLDLELEIGDRLPLRGLTLISLARAAQITRTDDLLA
jgi:hypothetical protein